MISESPGNIWYELAKGLQKSPLTHIDLPFEQDQTPELTDLELSYKVPSLLSKVWPETPADLALRTCFIKAKSLLELLSPARSGVLRKAELDTVCLHIKDCWLDILKHFQAILP